jgi:hypothetical protein
MLGILQLLAFFLLNISLRFAEIKKNKMKLFVLILPALISCALDIFVVRKSSEGIYGFTIQTKAKRNRFKNIHSL